MKHKIVSRIQDGPFRYQAWPTVAKAKDGTLFLGVAGHRQGHFCPFGKNYMFKSYDDAKSWEGPIIVNDSPFDDRDAGIVPLGDNCATPVSADARGTKITAAASATTAAVLIKIFLI